MKTTDIVLAAYLSANGYHIIQITLNGKKGTFHFNHIETEVIQAYDLGQATVEPISFNQEIKRLATAVRRMTQDDRNGS